MKIRFLPLFLLALAGCRSTSAPAQETPTPTKTIARETPLDQYLARPEPAYKWEKTEGLDGDLNLKLTSQTWQGKDWTHRLQIFQPTEMKHPDAAILWVTFGGGNFAESLLGRALADATGAVCVNIFNVPNQPLFGKSEDALIAHSFQKYMETGDETWPLLFPMTKSVVKTMDALNEWSQKENDGQKITRFMVAGGSKRGWTTWLSAAGDERVIAIAPIVYNFLNMPDQIAHQKQVWGAASPMLDDYNSLDLTEKFTDTRGDKLTKMVDPYAYLDRLKLPKLIINATNDQYWPHDSMQFYRNKLEGPFNVFYVPNAPHMLNNSLPDVVGSAAAWGKLVLNGEDLPVVEMNVEKAETGRVFTLKTDAAPQIVRLWMASSKTKDFRKAKWTSMELQPRNGAYSATVSDEKLLPTGAKFAAAFGEIEVPGNPLPLRLSSAMWEN